METDTSQQLLATISEASGLPVSAIREDMSTEELGLDSLDVVEMLKVLGIPYEAIDELHTVREINAYLSNRAVG